jgi:excisionase family DNA binding protein
MSRHKKPSAETDNSAIQTNTVGVLPALPILTKAQACELLACTPRYLERAIRSGRLRACKPTGKFVRIFRKDLDAFLENCASIAA